MSTIRDPATITKVGRQMMTAGGDITYTKATLYGQDISHLTKDQLESLTSIGNPLVTVPLGISDKNDNGNGTTVILEATFQNSNLKADLPYTAVGFFAKRGDDAEKLIAVGVATEGAYLAAASPNGIATDALDIKVAIAIGDSANVTAMIDPAGSVTPAALHNAITDVKSEMKTGLDTKADKSTVDSDVKSINDTLATKADKQTVTDDLATKADKTDVDAQIGTVNKSVSDLSDTVKANKDDADKTLATKADKATVESELSTKANQSDLDKTNAEVAKKASTTDVNSQLATKADAKDVTDALALKDDTVDVDKKISNVTNSVNSLSSTVTSNKSATDTALGTKANANDVANSFEEVRNRVKKLEGQQELTAPDFNTLTSTGIYMIENPTSGKNSPSNGNWGILVVSRGTTGSDSRILQEYYPDSGDLPYFRMSGPGGVWRDWKQLSDQSEINSLRDAVNTKVDKTDVAKDIDTVNKSISSMSATITANQKATDTALDTKADKTTVNQELATKANSIDVDDKLAAKADSADVTKQIKTITDLANSKADQTALDATNATVATKANSTDVYTKTDTDKLLDAKADKAAVEQSLSTKANSADVDKKLDKKADKSSVDAKINAIDFSKIKFRKQRVNSDGQAADTTWSATKNSDGSYTIDIYQDDWTAYKVASLLQAITTKADQSSLDATNKTVATKANSSDVYTKKQVDDAFSSRDATIATKADKAMVDTEISKIDFTPYAKTADVNKEIKTVTDLANTKVDATYSYSKAELDKKLLALFTDTSGKVNASQVASMIAGKADKTDVDQKIATVNKSVSDLSDTVSANKTATDASLATKANASDVADNVKTLQANIDTKADKATVDAEIAKIDFTPYAKSADVDSKLKGYTDTADLTKLLAGKADSDFSYSKAELDKKLLDLTTTTGGKVDASQVATMIENKADKSDVTKQIGTVTDLVNTKANSTDVDAALDKKDDITDVDAKIKKVTDLANKAQSTADSKVKSNWAIDNSNGKFVAANVPAVDTATQSFTQTGLDLLNTLATKSQVADAKNTANQAIDDYNKRPVIRGNDGDDLLAYKTNQLRLYVDVKNCKNLPPASNTQWFTVEYIFENPNDDGVAIFRSPASEVWLNGNNGGNYNNWLRLANAGDITNLQNAINTKANSSDVYTKSDVDYRTRGTIITDYDIASLTPTKENNNYRNRWLVDQNVLPKFAEQINQLKGRRTVDSPDFNNMTDTGTYYITNNATKNIKNNPVGQWGVLIVSNGNGHRISQVYYPDDGNPPWYRSLDESTWRPWYQLSTRYDVGNATNAANAASNKIDTVLANSYVRKQGMNANGDCVEIKHTGIKQANGGYAFDMWSDDWTASKLNDVIKNQLPSKANTADVNNALNDKANAGDVSALQNKVNVNTPLFRKISADSTWEDIFGVTNPNNVLTSLRINPGGSGQLVNDFAAGIGFGGNDTKAVISVDYGSHVARFTAGNGTSPGWSEDVAWKSDINNVNNQINSTNQTVSALQQTIKTLNDTLSSANATIKTLQDTITKQATTITGLQTQVSNQANEISYIKANYIEGKRFSKSQEAAAEAWEKQNPQRLAFITDN